MKLIFWSKYRQRKAEQMFRNLDVGWGPNQQDDPSKAIYGIQHSLSIDELKRYNMLASKDEYLQGLYNQRLKELSK
jgi:hypothetical protein